MAIQIIMQDYCPKVLKPAEIRMNQLLAVCDSVDGLPKAFKSFNQFCDHISDLQTRRLLHQLHQIRPGERHLRSVVFKVLDNSSLDAGR